MHRFGSRLMKLEPALNAVNAAQQAAAAYAQHATVSEPKRAELTTGGSLSPQTSARYVGG